MRRDRFVAILQRSDGGTAGGAAGGQRCAGLTGWTRKEFIVPGKSGRIRQHIYGVKAGISQERVWGRKVGRSAYN